MKERKEYQSPQVKVVPVRNTQLLCASASTEKVSKSSFYYDFDTESN